MQGAILKSVFNKLGSAFLHFYSDGFLELEYVMNQKSTSISPVPHFKIVEYCNGKQEATNGLRSFLFAIRKEPRKYSDSHYWFQRAIEKGHLQGYLYLGKLSFEGNGVSKDVHEALRYFHKAHKYLEQECQRIRALHHLERMFKCLTPH
ncbi:hypothetical protein G9A89_001739 [Geosiphon pyriformis]|nr:hypothetical protein G9A89_001739 [Geosiphon pyriformis]